MEEERKEAKTGKLYKDPRKKGQDRVTVAPAQETRSTAQESAPQHKAKKQKVIAATDRKVRETTKVRTMMQNEEMKERQKKPRRKNKKRVWKQPTQAEILQEAKETERKNTESLHAIRQWEEEEKARRKVKGPVLTGPRVVYHSKGAKTTLIFRDCDDDPESLPDFFASLRGRTGTVPNFSARQNLVGAQVASLLLVP